MNMYGPDPNGKYPNPALTQICFIKNVIRNPYIQIGEYTYFDDPEAADFRSQGCATEEQVVAE